MLWTADVDDGPHRARTVAPPAMLAIAGNRAGDFVACVVELLTESTEPGLLVDGNGNVHWANEPFWQLPWVDRANGALVLDAALSPDSRDALADALHALRVDHTSQRVRLRPDRSLDGTDVMMSLTSLERAGSDLVAARVIEPAGTRGLAARAWAMEAALLQIRRDLLALHHDDRETATNGGTSSVPLPPDLPARQRDVARLILEGRSIEDIAATLELSPHTVRNHLKVVFRRTGVHSRAAFVARYHL